ncbi:hypothetical protein J2X54_003603 [Duganella sp. 3397]|uniref:hypothetical protein n=1 Tax=Duganella sp. 3397 TaxID=2817732 RepID=UPI0028618334|nr:hypothetical protein [Duganella sp. 3397]MDR7051116.1 hypothetical protein [Duganella sp. 3397]
MKRLISILLLALAAGACTVTLASPGAHGPNGEHLDGAAAASTGGTAPRVETFSELFELVGTLSGSELSVMIDRYETNAPVLDGKLDVEVEGIKAQARFHADIGDYAFDDPRLLAALSRPGKHALLFTLVADGESDLLDGTLEVTAQVSHDHAPVSRWWWLLSLPLAIAAVALVRWRSRRAHGQLPRQEQPT